MVLLPKLNHPLSQKIFLYLVIHVYIPLSPLRPMSVESRKSIAPGCIFINILPYFCNRITMIATGPSVSGISATGAVSRLTCNHIHSRTILVFSAFVKDKARTNTLLPCSVLDNVGQIVTMGAIQFGGNNMIWHKKDAQMVRKNNERLR